MTRLVVQIEPVPFVGCRLLRQLALPLLLSTRLAAGEAAAPDCVEQDPTVCGRRHFETGTQAFEKSDFATAAVEFQAALAQRPHPVIRFNLALSFAKLGRPSAAIEQLRLVQADAAVDKDLRARAEREQRSAEQSRSRVTFRLSDPSRERVELDGASVEVRGQELAVDPGPHHVRVLSGSSVVLDQDLELAPGERVELRVGERSRRIDVVVVPDAAAPSTKPAAEARVAPATAGKLSPAWFYAGAGATVVLTGLTVWSGLDTRSALTDYERDLPKLSQDQANARVESGHSRELRTNLLLAGSLVCGVGTAVFGIWLVDFGGQRQTSFGMAPNGVALSGRF